VWYIVFNELNNLKINLLQNDAMEGSSAASVCTGSTWKACILKDFWVSFAEFLIQWAWGGL
jgi:hypothetical protein